MSIAIIGISHKTAELDIRELVSIPEYRLLEALAYFQAALPGSDIMILSTCNRTEVYSSCTQFDLLIQCFAKFHGMLPKTLTPYLYCHEGLDALAHAMKVCSSLDSMVLGEPQIFGQMKKAFTTAQQQGCVTRHLELAFQHIFSAAKAVRSRTNIGQCPVSVAYHAAYLAKENLHYPESQNVLIIGAGSTSALLAQHMKAIGCKNITLLNRSLERAEALAEHLSLEAANLTALPELLPLADVIISATESAEYIVTYSMVQAALLERIKPTPLFFVDVANPRDIDPEIASLPECFVYNLDDLHKQIDQNAQRRQSTVHQAEKIISQHQTAYLATIRARHSVAAIKNIRQKAELLKEQEILASLKLLEQGKDPEAIILRLANRLTQKWLHQPCVNLRDASVNGQAHILDAALALFDELD